MSDFPVVGRPTPLPVAPSFLPVEFAAATIAPAQIIAMLRARLAVVLLLLFCGLAATVVTLTLWPRTYLATAVLSVNYEISDPQNGENLPMAQIGSYIATQQALLQTREVLVQVVQDLGLATDPNYRRGYKPTAGNVDDWVAAALSRNLSVWQGSGGSQLIYVGFTARSAHLAARVANAVVAVYRAQQNARMSAVPAERQARYNAELSQLKSKMDDAQEQLTTFNSRTSLVSLAGNADLGPLMAAQNNLANAQAARRESQARIANALSPAGAATGSAQIRDLVAQLDNQDAKLAQLNNEFTPKHPLILKVMQEREIIQAQLAAAMKNSTNDAAMSLRSSEQVEQSLREEVAFERSRLIRQGAYRDEAAKLQLALDSAQTVYKKSLEGYDAMVFASTGNTNNLSVVSPATPPAEATSPRLLRGLAIGMVLSLGFSIVLPLAYELLNRRVRSRHDLESDHGIPVLAELFSSRAR